MTPQGESTTSPIGWPLIKNVKTITPTNHEKANALVATHGHTERELLERMDELPISEEIPVNAHWRPTHFD